MQNVKFVILGPSSAGKSTIGNILKNKYDLPIFECDDETRRLNNGRWPSSIKVVDQLFSKVNQEAWQKENIVYITSFLNEQEVSQFIEKDFKFVVLYANFDFLLQRRLKREKLTPNLLERFKKRYQSLMNLVNSPYFSKYFPLKIDVSTLTNETIADDIYHYIYQS